MTVTLTEPGVQVTESIRTTSPTITTPTLRACLIGPCKQLVDVLDSTNSIDADALAGTYTGSQKSFSFPGLLDAAVVIESKVRVFIRYGSSTTLVELEDTEFEIVDGAAGIPEYVRIFAGADGIVAGSTKVRVYIQFEALRTDVTANPATSGSAGAPRGIVIETLADITTYLGDISVRNPLALAAYLAKVNATNTSIVCIGIDELGNTTYGTSDAYSRALEAMEGVDVYTMVPLSQNTTVLSLFPTHVNSMSDQTHKRERICFLNYELPTTEADETIASGPYGNSVTGQLHQFNTGVDLAAEGVTAGDILEISGETDLWTVTGITGTYIVTLDATDANIPTGLIDVDWEIYREGAALTTKSDTADAMAAIGTSINNRRVFVWFPDTVEVDVDGLTYELPGFYGAAATAGQIGEKAPQAPLTNFPIAGIAGLDNSDDYFSPDQLSAIRAGGIYVVIQPSGEASPRCQHQLSTNITSIQTRELSITTVLDFLAKTLRNALSPLIGIYVIDTRFINSQIAPIVSGIKSVVEPNTVEKLNIIKMAQSETFPDTVEIEIEVTPLYPCNTIKVTLIV